ncbi:MAG: sugar ABC transporter permease [Clostridia bacterium]|nr:sugar ABC transporter permease [Clostridia bacterium]
MIENNQTNTIETEATPEVSGAATSIKKKMGKRERMQYMGVLWILPALVMLAIFCLYPTFTAFQIAFTDWNGNPRVQMNFVWFRNFILVLKDWLFWRSMWNVIILTVVGMILGNAANVLLAELMYNLRSKFAPVYRFLFVLPAMIPGIVVMLLWHQLILHGSEASVMNKLIGLFGAKPIEWLDSDNTVIVFLSIFIYGFPWMGGTSFLIYLAGLNGIDESVVEASRLDGVGTWKRVFAIDLPLLKGQIKYFLVMGFIGGLQNYSMQFAITNGGPGTMISETGLMTGTMVPGFYIYQLINNTSIHAEYGAYGYACAIGVVMFVIIMVITVINNKLVKSED